MNLIDLLGITVTEQEIIIKSSNVIRYLEKGSAEYLFKNSEFQYNKVGSIEIKNNVMHITIK